MGEKKKSGKSAPILRKMGSDVRGSGSCADVWVLGGGQMGGAVARYLVSPEGPEARVTVVDPDPETLTRLEQDGIAGFLSFPDLVRAGVNRPGIIVLAVKPAVFLTMDPGFRKGFSGLPQGTLGLSLMAGVSLESLETLVPEVRWIRAMTNLALSTGKGMTVLSTGPGVTRSEGETVMSIFAGMGKALWLPEAAFDAATAIAGSGPGLLALVAEALADGGVREGLGRETATTLAAWALFGAGSLMAEREIVPETLKARVASPSGTTIEGLAVLEDRGVRGALIEAVRAMAEKSRTLSRRS